MHVRVCVCACVHDFNARVRTHIDFFNCLCSTLIIMDALVVSIAAIATLQLLLLPLMLLILIVKQKVSSNIDRHDRKVIGKSTSHFTGTIESVVVKTNLYQVEMNIRNTSGLIKLNRNLYESVCVCIYVKKKRCICFFNATECSLLLFKEKF